MKSNTHNLSLLPLAGGIKKALGSSSLKYAVPAAALLMMGSTAALAVPSAYVFFNDNLITQPQPQPPTTVAATPTIIIGDVPLTSTSCVDFGYVAPSGTVTKMFSIVSTETGPASGGSYDALSSITFTGGTEFQQIGTAQNATALTNGVVITTGAVSTAPLAPIGTFDIKFTAPSTILPITNRQINIYTSTDPETNPLSVIATATVVSSMTPQIQVLDSTLAVAPAGTDVVNSSTTAIDFTPTPTISGNTITKTFSVKNVGATDLLLLPATATFTPDTGTGISDFTVTTFVDDGNVDKVTPVAALPLALPLTITPPPSQGCPASSSTLDYSKFTVAFTAPSVSKQTTYTGVISFTSNDKGTVGTKFSFPVKATVNPPPPSKPEIDVYDGTTIISNNTATPVDFGTAMVGKPVQRTITLKNPSTVPLSVYDFSGNLPVGYSLLNPSYASVIPAGGVTNLIFQLDAATSGTFKGNMRIPSNDDNNTMWEFNGGGYENPYTFPFLGVVNVNTSGNLALNFTTPTNGLVTSDTGGLNCGTGSTVCTATYTPQTSVILTAKPDTGTTFTSWGGDCSGTTNPLTVVIDVAKNCSATFTGGGSTSTKYSLSLTSPTNGTISSDVGGINCGSGGTVCSAQYDTGASVKLTATPAANATFTSWGGTDCTGTTSPFTMTMDKSKSCTASFTANVSTKFTLTLTAPTGGSISSDIGGLNCGTTCAGDYDQNATVNLTATPATGMVFDAWSGDCAGTTSPLSLTMDKVKGCSATFKSNPTPTTTVSLTVTAPTNGTVKSNPGVINCGLQGTVCTDSSFVKGAQVTLSATPVTGGKFTSWIGDCSTSTTDSVTLTMDAAKTCSATFEGTASNQSDLVVTVTGAGKVARIPAGSTCGTGTDCTNYTTGDPVALSARADTGSVFDTWGGDCAGQTGSLILITMDKAKTCTATFKTSALTQTLTVSKTGNGAIKSDIGGIDCGTVCTATYPQGNPVNLTATPDATSTFAGWGGDCASAATGNPAVVKMDADKSCTATFNTKSQEATCFDQGGILTADGKCATATALTIESTTGTTSSLVKGGASKNGSSGYGPYKSSDSVMVLLDLIRTAVALKIDPADKGQKVDLLAAGLYIFTNTTPPVPVWYMLVGCSSCPLGWNVGVKPLATGSDALPILSALEAYKSVTLDSDYLTIPLYEGSLPEMGTLDIYAGYRITGSGKLVFNTTPIHLDIVPRP
jgi:hypothetical protein